MKIPISRPADGREICPGCKGPLEARVTSVIRSIILRKKPVSRAARKTIGIRAAAVQAEHAHERILFLIRGGREPQSRCAVDGETIPIHSPSARRPEADPARRFDSLKGVQISQVFCLIERVVGLKVANWA